MTLQAPASPSTLSLLQIPVCSYCPLNYFTLLFLSRHIFTLSLTFPVSAWILLCFLVLSLLLQI